MSKGGGKYLFATAAVASLTAIVVRVIGELRRASSISDRDVTQ